MSGDPPHHHHNRPWDYIGIPGWRQPQHAHMAHKHSIIPNWHPPTTEAMKVLGQLPHNFALHQMFDNITTLPSTNQPPGVDLSVTSQNGEPITPISLSVKDVKKLMPQTTTTPSPISKNKTESELTTTTKRTSPLDSVLERLKPSVVNTKEDLTKIPEIIVEQQQQPEKLQDESSDSLNVQKDESPYNTEDSLDSNKSRRKRKPNKTIRCSKNNEETNSNQIEIVLINDDIKTKDVELRKSSSESETIDNIAAMVQDGLEEDKKIERNEEVVNDITFVPVSVIKNNEIENCQESTITESSTTTKLITPAQKKETHFVEIENKLEEMFAGIEDVQEQKKEDLEETNKDIIKQVASTSQVTSTSNDIKEKKQKQQIIGNKIKKKNKKNLVKKTLKKKLIKETRNKKKNVKVESLKEYSYDSSSNSSKSKGPFIHIKGPRSSPISVNVINTPNEDEVEKKFKTKKFHDDSEYRHKVRSKGLHCSTLSNKYDAQTKDATWICVFCKKGPHTTEIKNLTKIIHSYPSGDLFGPYFINNNCEEYDKRYDDPYDKQFRSKKFIRSLDVCSTIGTGTSTKKSKRKLSESDDLSDPNLGIIEINENNYEIWAHEECIVWSPGVYLIGHKIIGLQEAVWTSFNINCDKCNLKGANICCLYRGCVKVAHVWCSKSMNWHFDEDTFKTYCKDHRKFLKNNDDF